MAAVIRPLLLRAVTRLPRTFTTAETSGTFAGRSRIVNFRRETPAGGGAAGAGVSAATSTGGVLTVKLRVAGVVSVLPAPSVAATEKVCAVVERGGGER